MGGASRVGRGFELTRRLRSNHPEPHKHPISLLTLCTQRKTAAAAPRPRVDVASYSASNERVCERRSMASAACREGGGRRGGGQASGRAGQRAGPVSPPPNLGRPPRHTQALSRRFLSEAHPRPQPPPAPAPAPASCLERVAVLERGHRVHQPGHRVGQRVPHAGHGGGTAGREVGGGWLGGWRGRARAPVGRELEGAGVGVARAGVNMLVRAAGHGGGRLRAANRRRGGAACAARRARAEGAAHRQPAHPSNPANSSLTCGRGGRAARGGPRVAWRCVGRRDARQARKRRASARLPRPRERPTAAHPTPHTPPSRHTRLQRHGERRRARPNPLPLTSCRPPPWTPGSPPAPPASWRATPTAAPAPP